MLVLLMTVIDYHHYYNDHRLWMTVLGASWFLVQPFRGCDHLSDGVSWKGGEDKDGGPIVTAIQQLMNSHGWRWLVTLDSNQPNNGGESAFFRLGSLGELMGESTGQSYNCCLKRRLPADVHINPVTGLFEGASLTHKRFGSRFWAAMVGFMERLLPLINWWLVGSKMTTRDARRFAHHWQMQIYWRSSRHVKHPGSNPCH